MSDKTITTLPDFEPYSVVENNDGCTKCQRGSTWDIIGPDGVAEGTSYTNEDDAIEQSEALNSAYIKGWQHVRS